MKRSLLLCLWAAQLWSCGQITKVQATTYNSPPDPIPSILSSGDVLNISDVFGSGYISDAAPGSVVNLLSGGGIYGGVIRGSFNSNAGAAGMGSGTFDGATVNALGGNFGIPGTRNGSVLNIDGAHFLSLNSSGSTVVFRSGEFRGGFFVNTRMDVYAPLGSGEYRVESGSTFNFFGGQLNAGNGAILYVGGELHFRMKTAFLGGASIPGLSPGASVVIPGRNAVLSGLLADGSALNMFLDTRNSNARFQFSPTSVVRVTLVPEPAGAAGIVVALVCAIPRGCRPVGARGT